MAKLNFCIVIPIFNEEEIVLDIINKALIFAKRYKSKYTEDTSISARYQVGFGLQEIRRARFEAESS